MPAPTFTKFGRFGLSRVSQNQYQIGEVALDVSVKPTEEELKELQEFIDYYFGKDSYIIGEVSFATIVFQVGSKKLRKEFGEKLLAEGREAEAQSYLKDI